MMAQDATNIDEKPLSEWLFGSFLPARLLADAFQFEPGATPVFQLPTRQIAPDAAGPGDIDVLVSGPGCPDKAFAFEVKRVKVPADAFSVGRPGKVAGLERGVRQANLLGQVGFHRTYLLVVVVTDGRECSNANFAGRGPTSEILGIVETFRGRNLVRPEVGLAFVELTQPVDKDIQLAGSIGIRIEKQAAAVTQPEILTKAVAARWTHESSSQ